MKKMKKTVTKCLILAALCAAFLTLGSCGKTCKASGCSNPVYKDGYCEIHYAEKAAKDFVNSLF